MRLPIPARDKWFRSKREDMHVNTTYLHSCGEPLDATRSEVEIRWESLPDSPPSAALPRCYVLHPNDTTPD
jgi:hypothetical protein